MTKVSIIHVDLGISVDSIIAGDLSVLTDRNVLEISNAVEQSKRVQEQKSRLELIKQKKEQNADEIKQILAAIYDKLLIGPILGADLAAIISNRIPNLSAFTTRMKAHLKANNAPYTLEKTTSHGCASYSLRPQNV